ncbi:unnamed protein product, partial [Hapterophycus canaliculatus]
MMYGRAPRTSFSALVSVTGRERNVDVMDADALCEKVRRVVDEQARFCEEVKAALMSTWRGPWRVLGADHAHVYSAHNIVYGKVPNGHVAHLRFYADAQLNISVDLKDVFQHSYAQG